MGNAAYRQTTANPNMDQDLKSFMQLDLPRFVWQDKIGNGKFMKSYVMRVESTELVVKVYMKLSDEDLQQAAYKLTTIWKVLSPTKFPSLMPYQMWIRSNARIKSVNTPVYLIRQYFTTNLSDRLSTRPFLNELEKYWIIFQLFKCLEICHEHKIVHGDIKPENIMCTTSNWVILTDFASFKPTFIPDDDPTDFQFYFDTMARHKCYIAPERFYRREMKGKSGTNPASATGTSQGNNNSSNTPKFRARSVVTGGGSSGQNTAESPFLPAIDVFSLGCVIAEILLDGNTLFDLPSMLQYLSLPNEGLGFTMVNNSKDEEDKGKSELEESPARQILSRIKNPLIRAVIMDMTQKDPEKRLSASDYLKILFGNVEKFHDTYGYLASGGGAGEGSNLMFSTFPSYFDTCIYPLYLKLHWNGVTPDDRIIIICETYDNIMEKITGESDAEGSYFFGLSLENNSRLLVTALTLDMKNQSSLLLPPVSQQLLASPSEETSKLASIKPEILEKARRSDLVKPEPIRKDIEAALNEAKARVRSIESSTSTSSSTDPNVLKTRAIQDMFSHAKSKDFFKVIRNKDSNHNTRQSYEGLVLIIDLLCANYRHLKYLTSRVTCLMLLGRIGRLCVDSVILQRIVPFLLVALEDSYALIKITALRIITALTSIVEEFDPIEVNYFPQYIFPNLGRIARDNELIVRIAFAECMGTLALTAKHFLDRGQSIFLHRAISEAIMNNQDINKIAIEFPYDQKLELLKDQVARWIRDIVMEIPSSSLSGTSKNKGSSSSAGGGSVGSTISPDSSVKKVILQHIMELCAFFGQESAMEKLLTQLLTFPNDQDWELRCAFCMKIPTVAAFLGTTVTSEYIVPCLENTIYDVEEKVSLSTIVAITSLIQMKLISKYLIVDFIQKCKSLLIHSSKAIRMATIELFVIACQVVGEITTAVSIIPEIRKILRYPLLPSAISIENLRLSIAAPLSREKIRLALWNKLKEQAAAGGGSSHINLNELIYNAIPALEDAILNEKIMMKDGGNSNYTNISEDERIQFISSYLNSSAREIFNKSLRWRAVNRSSSNTGGGSRGGSNNNASSKGGSSKNNKVPAAEVINPNELRYTNSLLWTNLNSLENNAFCFQIPHVKSATYLTEDWRKQSVFLDADEGRNQQKIRYFFMGALALMRGDNAHRSLVVNGADLNPEDAFAFAGGPAPTSAAAVGMTSPTVPRAGSIVPSMAVVANDTFNAAYSNGSYRFSTSFGTNSISLLRRLKALNVPPLPVEMGSLLSTTEEKNPNDLTDANQAYESANLKAWRPKEGVLMLTLREHKGSVNRLVVSPDHSYFASVSSDRTVRIWQTRQLDRINFFKSCAVYKGHHGAVTDAAVIDSTHSVASGSKDGSVHVWRVDMQGKPVETTPNAPNAEAATGIPRSTAYVTGTSLIRTVESGEGEVLSVQHFNSDVASIVTFATQRGGVHGWDLRMPQEAFKFAVRPELGFVTTMTVSPERNFICTGTSKGYLVLWDVRYNIVSQAWRHSSCSSIHRLASGKAIRNPNQNLSGLPSADGAYLFVAAGDNESAVFGLPDGGECLKCFRSLSLDDNKAPIADLPRLEEIALPRHPASPFSSSFLNSNKIVNMYPNSIKAMLGRVSPNNASYLITAGTDRHIRFWDFRQVESCYTVAGLELTQMKTIYKKDEKSGAKLFVSYTPMIPASDKILQSHLPAREGRGLSGAPTSFKDAVLDLKDIDYPIKLLLAGSRDGEIKIWR